MKKTKRWYIKERHNPQTGVYFIRLGQLSRREAKANESALYGYNIIRAFDSAQEYEAEFARLISTGERVQ